MQNSPYPPKKGIYLLTAEHCQKHYTQPFYPSGSFSRLFQSRYREIVRKNTTEEILKNLV